MTSRRESRGRERTSRPTAMELMARLVRSWTLESKVWRSGSERQAASYELRSAAEVFICVFESESVLELGFGLEMVRAGGSAKGGGGGRWRLLLLRRFVLLI